MTEAAPRRRQRVVAVGRLPPPLDGTARVSEVMVAVLAEAGLLTEAINIGPPDDAGGRNARLRRLGRALRACWRLGVLRRRGADTLYMPCDIGLAVGLNVLVAAAARLLGYRVWLHHHNFSYISRWQAGMAALVALSPRRTRHIVLCAGMGAELGVRYGWVWRWRKAAPVLLPNAFMVPAAAGATRPAGPLVIGHLANLSVAKGTVRFVALFRRLRLRGVDVIARVAGPVGDAATRQALEAAALEFPGSFRWGGPLKGAAKRAFYDAIDVFVLPSTSANEAQPLVLLEALARGAAIVAIDRGCIGCDHGEAPGAIFPDHRFDDDAERYLATLPVTMEARDRSAAAALAHLRRLNADALERLRLLIDEMGDA
ncbi:glycosyltransferase family 4 protein [Pseudoxanthobacter sp.]|uniref:glycosyltransferase family 4 protein n=1 Tax=Pseudoxanthobacter sp. TaxID=1925742 RepID=UPI002FE2CA56